VLVGRRLYDAKESPCKFAWNNGGLSGAIKRQITKKSIFALVAGACLGSQKHTSSSCETLGQI
jgi:hypothetical protein